MYVCASLQRSPPYITLILSTFLRGLPHAQPNQYSIILHCSHQSAFMNVPIIRINNNNNIIMLLCYCIHMPIPTYSHINFTGSLVAMETVTLTQLLGIKLCSQPENKDGLINWPKLTLTLSFSGLVPAMVCIVSHPCNSCTINSFWTSSSSSLTIPRKERAIDKRGTYWVSSKLGPGNEVMI